MQYSLKYEWCAERTVGVRTEREAKQRYRSEDLRKKKEEWVGRGPQIADEVKMSDKATRLLTQDGFYRLGESCECRWRVGTIISARLPECTE